MHKSMNRCMEVPDRFVYRDMQKYRYIKHSDLSWKSFEPVQDFFEPMQGLLRSLHQCIP
ncbi:hypothetical protein A2U01_0018038, partial [Trifolium medium]|nr:hypothetical protein [Trifolium medium]